MERDVDVERDLKGAKEWVVYIYNRWPEAIHSDNLLFFRYILPMRHGLNLETSLRYVVEFILRNNVKYGVYARVGRKLREKYPERYKRDEDLVEALEASYIKTLREAWW